MNEMRFVQLQEGSKELFDMAKEVWLPFIHEVNANDGKSQSDSEILNGLQKRVHIQGTRKASWKTTFIAGRNCIWSFVVVMTTTMNNVDTSVFHMINRLKDISIGMQLFHWLQNARGKRVLI